MIRLFVIASLTVTSLFVSGCGTMNAQGVNPRNTSRAVPGLTRQESERPRLYSRDEAPDNTSGDLNPQRRTGEVASDTTLIAVNDPVKKQNLIQWDTQPGWFYTLRYRRRGAPAWELMPNVINLPGTGRDIKVIDKLPTHMDHAYNVDAHREKLVGKRQR